MCMRPRLRSSVCFMKGLASRCTCRARRPRRVFPSCLNSQARQKKKRAGSLLSHHENRQRAQNKTIGLGIPSTLARRRPPAARRRRRPALPGARARVRRRPGGHAERGRELLTSPARRHASPTLPTGRAAAASHPSICWARACATPVLRLPRCCANPSGLRPARPLASPKPVTCITYNTPNHRPAASARARGADFVRGWGGAGSPLDSVA